MGVAEGVSDQVYALDKAVTGAKKYIAATFKGSSPLNL